MLGSLSCAPSPVLYSLFSQPFLPMFCCLRVTICPLPLPPALKPSLSLSSTANSEFSGEETRFIFRRTRTVNDYKSKTNTETVWQCKTFRAVYRLPLAITELILLRSRKPYILRAGDGCTIIYDISQLYRLCGARSGLPQLRRSSSCTWWVIVKGYCQSAAPVTWS